MALTVATILKADDILGLLEASLNEVGETQAIVVITMDYQEQVKVRHCGTAAEALGMIELAKVAIIDYREPAETD